MTDFTTAEVGKFGEIACLKYIKRVKKLKIYKKNARIGRLEADIIAYNKDYMVYIEVKTRRNDKNNVVRPSFAVDDNKRTNLINFAYAFDKTLPDRLKGKTPRIDVCEVFVVGGKKLRVCDINYIENAVIK